MIVTHLEDTQFVGFVKNFDNFLHNWRNKQIFVEYLKKMVTGIGTMQSTAPTIMNGNIVTSVEPVKRASDNRRVSVF